jgi:hypothetical protein
VALKDSIIRIYAEDNPQLRLRKKVKDVNLPKSHGSIIEIMVSWSLQRVR